MGIALKVIVSRHAALSAAAIAAFVHHFRAATLSSLWIAIFHLLLLPGLTIGNSFSGWHCDKWHSKKLEYLKDYLHSMHSN